MIELITIFATSFIIALSGDMIPGPLFAATISESVVRGWTAGPRFISGHAFLEVMMLSALLYGLAPFLVMDSVFAIIAISGAAVLFFMSYSMFRSLPGLSIEWSSDARVFGSLAMRGIVLSLSNPYWVIWWATIGLGYVMYCRTLGYKGIVAFLIGHIAGDLAWYTLALVVVARGRALLTLRIYRGIIFASAAFISAFAAYFAYSGIYRLS